MAISITAVSQLGSGTSCTIILPASQPQLAKVDQARPVFYPGEGRILVMEDEEMVREVVVGWMWQQLGYEAKLVADSQEAVAQFREAQENL